MTLLSGNYKLVTQSLQLKVWQCSDRWWNNSTVFQIRLNLVSGAVYTSPLGRKRNWSTTGSASLHRRTFHRVTTCSVPGDQCGRDDGAVAAEPAGGSGHQPLLLATPHYHRQEPQDPPHPHDQSHQRQNSAACLWRKTEAGEFFLCWGVTVESTQPHPPHLSVIFLWAELMCEVTGWTYNITSLT